MKKIFEQINKLVVFDPTVMDIQKLNQQKDSLANRLAAGIADMRESQIWSEKEIDDVQTFAISLFNKRYKLNKEIIISQLRNNWKF